MSETTETLDWTKSPCLTAALTGFALNVRISDELSARLNKMIADSGQVIHFSGHSNLFGGLMWYSGVPMDWWQVCRQLRNHGEVTAEFESEVKSWQEKNPNYPTYRPL